MPTHVRAEERTWRVERAWPDGDGVTVELAAPPDPAAGHRRAGRVAGDGTAALLPAGTDERLPGLADVASGGVVVSHRAGRRAVVRSFAGTRFTKVVRPGRGPGLAQAARAAVALTPHVALPPVLGAEDDRLVLGTLPGRSLLDLAGADLGTFGRAWSDWADAWAGVVVDVDPARAPRVHDARAEARVLRDWRDKATAVLAPGRLLLLDRAVAHIGGELVRGVPSVAAISHRDLHDQQVLWDPSAGVGVLDVDTLARAEAALDAGNLRAHIGLRRLQGAYSVQQATLAREQVDEMARRAAIDPVRLRVHEAAASARLACVYAFRPRWRSLVPALLDAALS